MSDEPLMPSEVRRKVLSQHREIEQMLSELEAGVAQLADGEVGCRAGQARGLCAAGHPGAAHELRGGAHGARDQRGRRVRPGTSATPARRACRAAARARPPGRPDSGSQLTERLAHRGRKLATMLRDDIEEEERDYVNEKLLRDNLIPATRSAASAPLTTTKDRHADQSDPRPHRFLGERQTR